MSYVSLVLPVSNRWPTYWTCRFWRRPFSYSARRNGRAMSSLTARGGGLPRFN